MTNKTYYRIVAALFLLLVITVANAFPTKVTLTKDANYAAGEGEILSLDTNKGKVLISYTQQEVYDVFKTAKTKQCFILETETETTADFNKPLGKSGVRSAKPVNC